METLKYGVWIEIFGIFSQHQKSTFSTVEELMQSKKKIEKL